MDQSNKSTVLLLLFVTFFVCITATDSVVVSVNSMLNVTLSTSKFIASKRIQILEIINNPSNITTFKLTFFNRSAQRYSNVYTYNVSGTWSVISQTHQTLSCSLVYENSSQAFRLLKFKNEGGVFSLLGKLTLSVNFNLNNDNTFETYLLLFKLSADIIEEITEIKVDNLGRIDEQEIQNLLSLQQIPLYLKLHLQIYILDGVQAARFIHLQLSTPNLFEPEYYWQNIGIFLIQVKAIQPLTNAAHHYYLCDYRLYRSIHTQGYESNAFKWILGEQFAPFVPYPIGDEGEDSQVIPIALIEVRYSCCSYHIPRFIQQSIHKQSISISPWCYRSYSINLSVLFFPPLYKLFYCNSSFDRRQFPRFLMFLTYLQQKKTNKIVHIININCCPASAFSLSSSFCPTEQI